GDRAADRPMLCDECGATRLRVLRAGVTRVREELAALFPGLRVLDVDAATGEIGDADILIGTEAVLHRPEIRRRRPALVAFLDFDQELLAPRYRAVAQAHWLATRGAQLLAGRPRGRPGDRSRPDRGRSAAGLSETSPRADSTERPARDRPFTTMTRWRLTRSGSSAIPCSSRRRRPSPSSTAPSPSS